ncbi:MAG TPA: 50S ribosomal protein L19e [Candidatus Aenigmarchaeota archaeon]|nr:50S ribosomal protein L19e [Candidatus Aenigmarchaeota archaeon]
MAGLRLQKRIAADILKVGVNRVWIDPEKINEVKNVITKAEIRKLIEKGTIKALPEKVRKRKVRKRRKGPGRRKGPTVRGKEEWIKTVRPLRRLIKELRDSGKITRSQYRKLFLLIKGGMFRSRTHLRLYLKQKGILKGE